MSIMTVEGLVESRSLGIVSPHEHLFVDIRNQAIGPEEATKRALAEQKVCITNLDILSRNPYAVKDNLVLDDISLAEEELLRFKEAGGAAIVDATVRGIGRDPSALLRVARATGVAIVTGCGYYTADTHPPSMENLSIEEIRDEMIQELTVGIGESAVRAGVIGEIGTSRSVHPDEKKVLCAAAGAHAATNAGVIVHTYPWGENAHEILDILAGAGVPPGKISINHVDVEINVAYCRSIVKKGAFIEFDDFGKEYYIDPWDRGYAGGVFARDIERVRTITILAAEGFGRNILISNDLCLKTMLHRYGGWGYDHILSHIVPMMRDEGIPQDQIEQMLGDNPKRFLDLARG